MRSILQGGRRWENPRPIQDLEEKFEPYKVTRELMQQVSKPVGTIFLHDFPAVRGGDVTDDVLDGPQSLFFARPNIN